MNQLFDVKINVVEDADLDIIRDVESKILNDESISDNELIYYLNYLVYMVRKKLALNSSKKVGDFIFSNKCDSAQSMLYHYFNKLNVKCVPVNIHSVISNVLGHSFIIAYFFQNNILKPYLIDPTYNQFFDKDRCSKENFTIINKIVVKTPDPGYFIMNDSEDNQNVIKRFLECGFMELSNENAKIYGDSFYKTKTGVTEDILDLETMPGSIYIKSFLKSNCEVSKTEEELYLSGLNVDTIIDFQNNNIKKV